MQQPSPPELIGQAPRFLETLEHVSSVAPIERPILIYGERGAGKELLAARLHFLSGRWDGPLVKVNCAAMNEELLESELFGHEAGAFTGASKKHLGRFERAEGGTLFLDEIASASLRVQEKLLRVIEYGEYERVGGEETRVADVRVVAAANIDLRTSANAGDFRPDLLDRLAFDVVVAPPLRERIEDIPVLAHFFAQRFAGEIGAPFPGFSAGAKRQLIAHPWPGNVRELKNAVERTTYRWIAAERHDEISEVTINPFAALDGETEYRSEAKPAGISPPQIQSTQSISDLRGHLDKIEREAVETALDQHGGSQKRAADALSLTYDQLRGIVRKHAIITR